MLVGLQGCGKTTTAVKLARLVAAQGKRVYLVSADVYRPAAMEQLKVLGGKIGAGIFAAAGLQDPIEICVQAVEEARRNGYEVIVVDTAGRLAIDAQMMDELKRIKAQINPSEILFVADAMTGQDAVNVAGRFDEQLGIDGVIMTKMDGDARGGAALSIKSVSGVPIKFIGVGEKADAFEPFYPDRLASRILGMGDMLTFIEKAETTLDEQKTKELARKVRSATFDLEDFLSQLKAVKKMGPVAQLMDMIPGMSKMANRLPEGAEEKQLKKD